MLVLASSDVDMVVHDGERVRVQGTLYLSTSTGIQMLLLPDWKDPGKAVLLCNQPVQRRKLAARRRAKFRGFYLRCAGTPNGACEEVE